ncbi:MAG: LolA family protein [Verrucomicrobiales bacterium]
MAQLNIARRSIAAATFFVLASGSAYGQKLEEVINKWLAAQTNIQTWTAEFTQSRHLKALASPLVSTGKVWFAAPANFRWQIGENPPQTIAIRDGDFMQVIYPKARRVERYRFDLESNKEMKETLALLQTGFPRSRAELNSQFEVKLEGETNQLFSLALEPNSSSAKRMLPLVKVLLETNHFTLAGTELHFVDGSKMVNRFSNISTNSTIPAELFKYSPPPDYKVT